MVEKFEFWRTPVWYHKLFVKFSLSFVFACVSWNCDAFSLQKKKCEFWHPHLRGGPILVLPNYVKFYLFICAYSEKFHQTRVSGSVLNLASFLKRIASVWHPQISSNFIFSSYLFILKISCVWREWLKSCNFGCPVWGVSPFWCTQILSFLHICQP